VQLRRAVALGALVVAVLLVALGVHSCQVSATNSALQNYTNSVSSLIARSDSTSSQLFGELRSAGSASNATQLQNQINQTLGVANAILKQAQDESVPDQVRTGNGDFVLALRMRADGIANIAAQIQPALGTSAAAAAITSIASDMARFYSSDVLYKEYAAPAIAGAVNAAGVRFSALNGGQFLPSIAWLNPSFIASQLHVSGPVSGKVSPGKHGHQLNSVSVNGTTLQTGSTNTLNASPAPTFTLSFTNTGVHNETNVVCKVNVSGTGVSGQTVVPETIAGQTATCQVTLGATPPTGTQQVVATIEKVPGESNVANNSLSLPVDFQ
jgi:hypothetical protein